MAISARSGFFQQADPFHEVVSHQFPLSEIESAFETCEWSGRDDCGVVRGVLVP